jgi:hypothetical protein
VCGLRDVVSHGRCRPARDGEIIDIIGARDLGALRYRMDEAEREEAGERAPEART